MNTGFLRIIFTLSLFVASISLHSQPVLDLKIFASGFDSPVDIENAGDDRIFIVEQDGRIVIVSKTGVKLPAPFLDIDAKVRSTGNEQGLLGLTFHPDYKINGYFFVNYTNNFGNTEIARFTVDSLDPDKADPASEKPILTINQPFSNHNAGDLNFGWDGMLYFGLGDGGSANDPQNRSQNPLTFLGKMIRIDINTDTSAYLIPLDNPFVGNPAILDEIWAIGVRNPWRFSFDRITHDMWIADVGQNVYEEIDFQPGTSSGGENYGWRCYEGNHNFNTSGCQPMNQYDFPVFEYAHGSTNGCSVTGGYVYRGGRYSRLYGHYIFTDYCSGSFWSVFQDPPMNFTTTYLDKFLTFQYSTLGEDRYGELYLAGRGIGNIYKISDTSCIPTAIIPGGDTLELCRDEPIPGIFGDSISYQWKLEGIDIPGAVLPVFIPVQNGWYSYRAQFNGCQNTSDSVFVVINEYPIVSFSGLDSSYRSTDPPAQLSGQPAGGWYTGPGIQGNTFDPALSGLGIHKIIYSFIDSKGCLASDTQSVDVIFGVGLIDRLVPMPINVYPNPADQFIMVQYPEWQGEIENLRLFNVTGKNLSAMVESENLGNGEIRLEINRLPAGIYFISLHTNTKAKMAQFLILR